MATSERPPVLVSSLPDLRVFLSSTPPSSKLYLDLEGNKLSRNGTISIITILAHATQTTSLIDVQVLGKSAFTTPDADGKTLKSILEDPNTPKYLWDLRNDADALWAHYQVRLAGVTDVQLLENAARPGDKTYLRGLETCVTKDLNLKFMASHRWTKTKREIRALMSQDIFSRRPMDVKTMQYCANDVAVLPDLHILYMKRLDSQWKEKVATESTRRVDQACAPAYEPQSEAKKLGPWGTGSDKKVVTLDEMMEMWEQEREDALAEEIFGNEDFYYEDYDDGDDVRCYADVWGDDAMDSCWDKNLISHNIPG
ncbi:ribonuclease H-like domain-containing protein [Xylariomycetidae sp. FL2044]|nr:ribonuclease H-like domain-containing protein [Xylariomycetidae sp. FL2044]